MISLHEEIAALRRELRETLARVAELENKLTLKDREQEWMGHCSKCGRGAWTVHQIGARCGLTTGQHEQCSGVFLLK